MLLVQAQAACPQIKDALRTSLTRAFTFQMCDAGRWHHVYFPACAMDAHTPIDFLTVHIELFVEQANLFDDFAAYHKRCAEWMIHREGFTCRVEGVAITSIQAAFIKATRQRKHLDGDLPEAGESKRAMLK